MQMTAYLNFKGDCEEAFKVYERCLDGQVGGIFRYAGSPYANTVPAEWQTKVMHGSMKVGGQELAGADVPPERYEAPKGFSLSLNMKNAEEADRIFQELASGGHVVVPLEKTFWAERFGMVVDRFGVPWMLNCEAAGEAVLTG